MIKYEEIFEQLKREVGKQFHFYMDEISNVGVLTLPFKDSSGDNFIIRLSENNRHFKLDDGGTTKSSLFLITETVGGVRPSRIIDSLTRSFNAHFNESEGLIELTSEYDDIIPKLLHFTKMLITLDTMLLEIAVEEKEKEKEKPHRVSLGPRASQKLWTPLKPLIKGEKVMRRFEIDGLTIPDWIVDFAYEPTVPHTAPLPDMVLLITVDLAVLDPITKAAHAYSRAIDIKAAHDNYGIRIAFDRHGQDSTSLHAANFLNRYQIDSKAYTSIDISERQDFVKLLRQIGQETGTMLAV